MPYLEETVVNTYWCPYLNLNWKMSSSEYWHGLKGGIFEMLQNKMCFYLQFFIGGKMSPFFRSWVKPGSVTHFLVRLAGEHLLLARPAEATPVLYCTIHPWLSNRSASLWCAIRHELDVVLLEGWFQFFFLAFFFFGGSGVLMLGVHPPED